MKYLLAIAAVLMPISAFAEDGPTFTATEAQAMFKLGAAQVQYQLAQQAAKSALDKLATPAQRAPSQEQTK